MEAKRWIGVILLTAGAMVAACTSDPNSPSSGDVLVSPDSVLLFIGNTQQFTATLPGSSSATFTWSTGDPNVATVDQTGLVTAKGKGKTVVIARTGSKSGTAIVQVADPLGSACARVDTLTAMSGSMTADWNDSKTTASQTFTIKQQLQADFVLVRQGLTNSILTLRGKPTGTMVLDEKITDNTTGQVATNAGSGPPVSIVDLTLRIDTQACTFNFSYQYGVNAVANGQALNPEAVAVLYSKDVPLGLWGQGIQYGASFPAYGLGAPPHTSTTDQYQVQSVFGSGLFDTPASRGDAPVTFQAVPSDSITP